MKLYTKNKGLVADINDKLYKALNNKFNCFKKFGKEALINEKEYFNLKESNLIYEKLDLDYSNIKQINFEILYQVRFNGGTISLSYIDHKNKLHYIDHEIYEDNNELLIELVQESCQPYDINDVVEWYKHLSPYFDLNLIEKYKIKLFDEVYKKEFNYSDKEYILSTGEGTDS
jgi:hypothetical protein